ncbi:peptidoglycan-binding domain-containing protein [Methylobacterium sp. R2-1]|uniref:peptidoglycan-binding domain-containing protein n=1 Tax=Methylobacterium sp. R2-1 TaxID=2587064 RepID=UPI0028A9ECBF|nr:peptidoglycan-binding domain-containing protein [Methylobacterium sp. R2-1]
MLPCNLEVTPETPSLPHPARARHLPSPSVNTSMTVAAIQRALLARGYGLGPSGADGDAGPRTISAVTAFQRSAGLVPGGIAGSKT